MAPTAVTASPTGNVEGHHDLETYLNKELNRSMRYTSPLSLVICELGGSVESESRDSLRQVFETTCKTSLRGYDYAASLSPDRFALVLPDADRYSTLAVVQRLREKCNEKLRSYPTWTLNIGVSCFPFDGETVETLFAAAVRSQVQYGAGTADLS